jgi:hypothetical protein
VRRIEANATGMKTRMRLIHAAANFASFFAFRGLSINESTFWRRDW